MLILYGITIFVSASLLFLVQPMFAKMALPLLGGTPAVWNTCMVFFQAMLLLGYLYAHATSRLLGVRRQAILHTLVLLLPALALPIAIASGAKPPAEDNPVGWLLGLLTVSVGLPFFVLSTTNPLLQQWFAKTGHRAAKDPYFLYAASNVGSMLALLAYPFILEPALPLPIQSLTWSVGYGVFAALAVCCAVGLWTSGHRGPPVAVPAANAPTSDNLTFRRRARWIALSLVPSSLMLGVTTYLTSDVASVPLFWILPLSIYLLTFILVFAGRPPIRHEWMLAAVPWIVLPVALCRFSVDIGPALMILVPVMFFVLCMVCHGELARDRPSTRHLTEFYLWMSAGGVLGGAFNALLAPLVFTTVAEYPIAIVAALALWPGRKPQAPGLGPRVLDFVLPGVLLAMLIALSTVFTPSSSSETLMKVFVLAVPALICFSFKERPMRFGLGIGAVLFVAQAQTALHHRQLYAERSFFGIHRVLADRDGTFHLLQHGTTYHGQQLLDPSERCVPRMYYHPDGPIAEILRSAANDPRVQRVGLVGLGTGALASFCQPRQHFTFYEIDPSVRRIAETPELFSYLSECAQGTVDIVMGDGRLRLAEAPAASFQLLVLDAFSSDSIPIHLLTEEAFRVYLDKLADGGILMFHISNRYLDLEPVLAALADRIGLVCLVRTDQQQLPEAQAIRQGRVNSKVAVFARRPEDLGDLAGNADWTLAEPRSGVEAWTDSYSNIMGILKW